jgi:hypothetical protein
MTPESAPVISRVSDWRQCGENPECREGPFQTAEMSAAATTTMNGVEAGDWRIARCTNGSLESRNGERKRRLLPEFWEIVQRMRNDRGELLSAR